MDLGFLPFGELNMVFRRIIYNALFVGLLTGLLLTAIQLVSVNPIIFAAEAYELEEAHDHGEHDHETWAPEDGFERTLATIVANVSASIGFAAILLALMNQVQISQVRGNNMQPINLLKGGLWGLAGFVAVFVVPGIGLPPEIPGIQAAAVEYRQVWWIFAVLCAVIGLAVIAFAAMKLKAVGLIFLALPYLVGAPHIEGPEFSHPDPAAVSALEQLHQQFILASGITNLLFWLALGICCTWVLNRWVLQGLSRDVAASA